MLGLALGLTLLTTVGNIVGSVLTAYSVKPGAFAQARLRWLLGFAGGFILAGALVEVLPHSVEEAPAWGPLLALGGYFLLYAIEQVFAGHAHAPTSTEANEHTLAREVDRPHLPITPVAGMVALGGFLLHDFVDGLGIGAGFAEGAGLGAFMFLAVLVHEVPAGVAVASLMLGSGRGRLSAVLAGTGIGFITLVAVPIPFWLGRINTGLTAGLVGLAGGSFLYIAVHSLIPSAVRGAGRWGFVAVPLGALLGVAAGLLVEG
ncbi:Zinc transporter ZupT [bacterium HR23]|nr:Zinc transporter ZupT [bacterium HR23]